jgi:low affinity Fe/Cu permease
MTGDARTRAGDAAREPPPDARPAAAPPLPAHCEPADVLGHPTWFTRFTKAVSRLSGRPAVFVAAVLAIVTWALLGPLFHFSSDWQLVVNTGTTIITFLMVFLIQSTQNRDTQAMHIKLDELIRATRGAHNKLLDLEELEEAELDRFRDRYEALARRARARPAADDESGTPDVDA